MHQTIVAHDSRDVDETYPIVKMPFFAWLRQHPYQVFHVALICYLRLDHEPLERRRGFLEQTDLDVYRHCFHYYWFRRLRGLDAWTTA